MSDMMKKEQGAIIVVVLFVIVAMTILGALTILISSIELEISCNERQLREILYNSESAAIEGVQRLTNTSPIDLEEKKLFWHHHAGSIVEKKIGFRDPLFWDVDGCDRDNGLQSPMGQQRYIASVERRLATGSSAIMTGTRLYMNEIYGMSTKYNTSEIIEIGYYLRY